MQLNVAISKPHLDVPVYRDTYILRVKSYHGRDIPIWEQREFSEADIEGPLLADVWKLLCDIDTIHEDYITDHDAYERLVNEFGYDKTAVDLVFQLIGTDFYSDDSLASMSSFELVWFDGQGNPFTCDVEFG